MTKLRLTLFAIILSIYGYYPPSSLADDYREVLEPVDKYSSCTPFYGVAGYSLGIVGNDWALTFEVPEEYFSGAFKAKKAYFYRGPNMHYYIGHPGGPARPPIPKTKEYSQTELASINVDIHRIKVYDKVNGPIEVVIDDFTINNRQFHIPGTVNIICMGPNP